MIVSPRVTSFSFSARIAALVLFGVIASTAARGASPLPHNSLVIFADHPLENDQWDALVGELHRAQAGAGRALAGELDIFRGVDLVPGLVVDMGISVYLAGDCTLLPHPQQYVTGALGWVKQVHGRIQPFVHIDCTRIAEMLGPMALGMKRDRRNTVMAEAIARVILHEWIHVATQETGHKKSGVMQSQFQVSDLLAEDQQINPRQQSCPDKKRDPGF